MKKALLFDRDGTINYRPVGEYVSSPDSFSFIPDFLEIFPKIHPDIILILITNQQGIGKGLMTVEDLNSAHTFMQNYLQDKYGRKFDHIEFCPHLATDKCSCRKPEPGMLLSAMKKFNLEKSDCFMIGDSDKDAIAASNAGIKSVIVGHEAEGAYSDFRIDNLNELTRLLPGYFI